MAFKTNNEKLKKIIQFPKEVEIIKLTLDINSTKLIRQSNLGLFELTHKSYVQYHNKNSRKCLKRRIMLNELFMSNIVNSKGFKVEIYMFQHLKHIGVEILKKDFIKEFNRLEELYKLFNEINENLGDA